MRKDAFGNNAQNELGDMFIQKYYLEFILHSFSASEQAVKNSLAEFGEDILVVDCQDETERGKNFKISIKTEDPPVVFDICAQFGRIKTVRIEELKS